VFSDARRATLTAKVGVREPGGAVIRLQEAKLPPGGSVTREVDLRSGSVIEVIDLSIAGRLIEKVLIGDADNFWHARTYLRVT
jgi:hypothetical protein